VFELLGLLAVVAIGGIACLFLAVLVLPFILFFKVVGWGLSTAAQAFGWLVGAILLLPVGLLLVPIALLLLPVVALVGGLILLKLAFLAAPLLLLGGLAWLLVSLARRPAAA
jgi:hypothetical protein